MKINKHHINPGFINPRVATTADAGLSAVPTFAQKPSTLAACISHAIHSCPLVLPIFACAMPGLVFANPEGGLVVGGSATISNPDANTTLITQTSASAAIDWQRFNIGSQEYVQFAQPDSSSVALNRVIGGNPSQILGNLSANGQVFLVNPNGVYFGQSATVDVGGIVASVHNIRNEDFMAGNYVFSKGEGAADAGVVNDGVITARDGGFVVLMGDYAHNNGVISARLGTVALAAGNRITMDVKGNGLVSVVIEEATLSDLAGVNNTGEIMATGGRVIMSARVANDLVDTAINNTGLVVANSITERNGVIFLTAAGGDVVNSGTLDASAEDGSNVAGGGVLVYSDKNVINASGAVISATGDGSGDGGVVRAIAEDFMDHQSGGRIDVTSDTGNGGFVELSGHGSLAIRGDVDIGTGGKLLIDPTVLTIVNGANTPGITSTLGANAFVGKKFIEDQLNTGVDVTLVASNSIGAAPGASGSTSAIFTITSTNPAGDLAIKIGTLSVGAGSLGGGSGVTGTAGGLAAFNCAGDGFCFGGTSTVFTPGTTGSVNLATVSFNLAGGLNVAGGVSSGNVNLNNINAGGAVTITAGGFVGLQSVTAGGSLNVSAGSVSVGSFSNPSNVIDVVGNVSIVAAGNIYMYAAVQQAGTSLILNAGNFLSLEREIGSSSSPLAANVELRGHDVSINANIHVANNSLTLAAASPNGGSDGSDFGSVNIFGGNGSPRTVSTQGNLNVSGDNFNVIGASIGTVGFNTGSVKVIADDGNALTTTDNITVNITGQMNVQGGAATGDASGFSADVSASVSAGNDVTITAASLNVAGGNALALNNSADSTTGSIIASASLAAGRDIVATLGGNLNVKGGIAIADAGPSSSPSQVANAFANADAIFSAANNITVNAGSINVQGGTANATLGTASATNCSACSAVATARADVNAAGVISFTATSTGASVTLLSGSANTSPTTTTQPISADAKVAVNAGTLNIISVSGDITGNNADISAAGLYISAGNNIDLQTSNITVGNGTVAGINGDALTLAFLASKGITPPTTPNPNAKFRAGGTLDLGIISMAGNAPYLWLEADTTNIQGLTSPLPSDVVVQFSPFTLTKTIGVEAALSTSQDVNYNYLDHFSGLPGTTIIIGSSLQTGAITIGDLSKVDIGAKNMVAVTASRITSISNVISTGIVAELIVGSSTFITPVLTDVEAPAGIVDDADKEKEKKKNLIKDEDAIKMCEAG